MEKDSIIYFIRHGETDANTSGLMCGCGWDIDLNKNGYSQALNLAQSESLVDLEIDRIFSSPLLRAKNTARIIANSLGMPVTIRPSLKEWNLGDWDKKPASEISPYFDSDIDPPNGENILDFHYRIINAVAKIKKESKIPLIVSHGAVWKRICVHFKINYFVIPNCRIIQISEGSANFI